MVRVGAVMVALALAGCGSTGGNSSSSSGSGSSSLFNTSALDLFNTSSKVTTGSTSGSEPLVDTEYDCPEVKLRYGAATLTVGDKPNQNEPNPLDVRYQGSITRTARECHLNGNIMTMKIGIEGRIITGPAGGPGTVDVPLRVAVVQEGPSPKTVTSKFAQESVTITSEADRANFTHIDPDVSFPVPTPASDITTYVVYVGFDPLGAQPPVKKPAPKHKPKPAAKPRSS
jgi:hypothetical protein